MTLASAYIALLLAQVNEFNGLAEFGMYGAVLVLFVGLGSWVIRAFMKMFRRTLDQMSDMHAEERRQNDRAFERIVEVSSDSTRVSAEAARAIAEATKTIQQNSRNEELRHELLMKQIRRTEDNIIKEIQTRLPRTYVHGRAKADTDA